MIVSGFGSVLSTLIDYWYTGGLNAQVYLQITVFASLFTLIDRIIITNRYNSKK